MKTQAPIARTLPVLAVAFACSWGFAAELPVVDGFPAVATVNGEPIWLKDLGREIESLQMMQEPGDKKAARQNRTKILDRMITARHLKGTGWEGEKPEEEAEHQLQDALWEMIRCPQNWVTQGKKHPFKLLNKAYLRNALTLRAIATFCARPVGRSHEGEVYAVSVRTPGCGRSFRGTTTLTWSRRPLPC